MSTTYDSTQQPSFDTLDDDFEILTIYPRESGPLEIGCLIRSKEDALNLHKVIRGHVQVTRGLGDRECKELGELILSRWDAADFSRSDSDRITELVEKLRSLYIYEVEDPLANPLFEEDGPEFGVVEAILRALRYAAWARTNNDDPQAINRKA